MHEKPAFYHAGNGFDRIFQVVRDIVEADIEY